MYTRRKYECNRINRHKGIFLRPFFLPLKKKMKKTSWSLERNRAMSDDEERREVLLGINHDGPNVEFHGQV